MLCLYSCLVVFNNVKYIMQYLRHDLLSCLPIYTSFMGLFIKSMSLVAMRRWLQIIALMQYGFMHY